LRILALTPHPIETSPGHRFRLGQWAPLLEERGIRLTYGPFASPALGRILYQRKRRLEKAARMVAAYGRQLARAGEAARFDLVYVLREAALIGPALLESWIARRGVPVVFDFDDAVFVRYESPANGYWSYLKCPEKTATLCRLASHVMAGNAYLAEYAARYNDRVTVVPTTIDTDRYRPELRRKTSERPTIGWTGSYSTAQHLKLVVPALQELAADIPFRLVVVGIEAPTIPGVELVTRPWRPDQEAVDLSDVDIGIMPLPDDDWSRGKCGLKALQFMALGIPTVVSPVGVNTEIVLHGENGLVAEGIADWVAKLRSLLGDADLRKRLGERSRRTVVEGYSTRAVLSRVVEIFRTAKEGPVEPGA
jgi:glycosyltransferase involved in cell wall biosynthesis